MSEILNAIKLLLFNSNPANIPNSQGGVGRAQGTELGHGASVSLKESKSLLYTNEETK